MREGLLAYLIANPSGEEHIPRRKGEIERRVAIDRTRHDESIRVFLLRIEIEIAVIACGILGFRDNTPLCWVACVRSSKSS